MSTVERSGLVVPVVLWGSKPPQLRISQLLTTRDGEIVVAGTHDGYIVQWKLSDGQLYPDKTLLAHDSAITCLANTAVTEFGNRFLSCCEKGQLCLWDIFDGRCVESVKHTLVHRKIVPMAYTIDELVTRLFCIGDYADVVVIDAHDLNVLYNIGSRVEPDWITSMTFVGTPSGRDLIGVSISGMIKRWSVHDLELQDPLNPVLDSNDGINTVYENESKMLSAKNVRSVSAWHVNGVASRAMLLVSSASWQMVDINNLNQLVVSECTIEAVDGICIGVDKIAVAFVDSTIVLFQLPPSKVYHSNPTLDNISQPFVIAILKEFTPLVPPQPLLSVCFSMTKFPCQGAGTVAYRADDRGRISFWKMPRSLDPLVASFLQRKRPIAYDPTLEVSLQDVWEQLDYAPPKIFDAEKRTITSTIYISNQGKLLLGMSDGSIVMLNACATIMAQLLDYTSTEAVQHRVLQGHRGPVTCFLYPFDENIRYDAHIFVSGGKDFAVITWNLTTGAMLHRFCSQGGEIERLLIPPDNCNPRILSTICSISNDNSVALLSLKENKCILLASRQINPVIEVKWRPLDDLMMVRCVDDSLYIWQMETASLDRIVTGLVSDDVMDACDEQVGVVDGDDGAGANQATQMFRALKNKNFAVVKRIAIHGDKSTQSKPSGSEMLPAAMDIVQIKKLSPETHVLLFNVGALITGLLALEYECANSWLTLNDTIVDGVAIGKSLTSWLARKNNTTGNPIKNAAMSQRLQAETNLYIDTARLLLSCLYAWNLNPNNDAIVTSPLIRLYKPKFSLQFGLISRHGITTLYMPSFKKPLTNFDYFSKNVHFNLSRTISAMHMVSVVALANTLMSARLHTGRGSLKRVSSSQSNDSIIEHDNQMIKDGWSAVAVMHYIALPNLLHKDVFHKPNINFLVRRWHDACIKIRGAAQALYIQELVRDGSECRKAYVDHWTTFIPTLLDPSLSIFGKTAASSIAVSSTNTPSVVTSTDTTSATTNGQNVPPPRPRPPPPRPPQPAAVQSSVAEPPPIPPRLSDGPVPLPAQLRKIQPCEHWPIIKNGFNEVRRKQATSLVVLGVIGAEFPGDFENVYDIRATAQSLLELLIAPESHLLPAYCSLRRAAIDLMGRGFTFWQPHLAISKVILALLELASKEEKFKDEQIQVYGALLPPVVDASRAARRALSLIANARGQAVITALSMEVARYNSVAQHQTIQHSLASPLVRSRTEVFRIIELLTEKRYNDVADLIVPVGEILVHCLDNNQLKHHTLVELFPPIAKFNMLDYCPVNRRLAFGGKSGQIVVHELKTSKALSAQAHTGPITSVSFSPDGKQIAVYCAKESVVSFWQSQQSFLGMGQNQLKLMKSLPAPSEFIVLTPEGSHIPFQARLIWIGTKAVTLMLPNGKENRFSL